VTCGERRGRARRPRRAVFFGLTAVAGDPHTADRLATLHWGGGRGRRGRSACDWRLPCRGLELLGAEGVEEFFEGEGGEAGGGVGDGVGKNEVAVVDEGAAGVDDVGDVAFALVGGGAEEGFFEAADDA
jgi:hypothetical protein